MFWLIRLGVVPRNKVLLTFSSAGPHQRRSAQVERNGSLDAAEGPGIPGRNHNADKARLSIGSVMVGRNAYRHAPAVARAGDWDSVSAGSHGDSAADIQTTATASASGSGNLNLKTTSTSRT